LGAREGPKAHTKTKGIWGKGRFYMQNIAAKWRILMLTHPGKMPDRYPV
jgi:hypothetical protein